MGTAFSFGGRMLLGSLACFVHGFLPWLCLTRGSDTIRTVAPSHGDPSHGVTAEPGRRLGRRGRRLVPLLFAGLFTAALPAAAQERSMVPVTIDGEQVKLAVISYKPAGSGPFPTLVFHHGSTGRGNDPSIFARPYEARVVGRMVHHTWMGGRASVASRPRRIGRSLRRRVRARQVAGLQLRPDAGAPGR